jgi:phosphinothricin acetyltransferase
MLIRDATEADIPAVTAIYTHHVLHGLGTFEETPPPAKEIAERWRGVAGLSLPWLVADDDGQVLGYAYATPFRSRSAYRYVAEDSVYVAPHAHRRGVGKALLAELIVRCEAIGLRQLMAVIGDSDNAGSIGVHRALGFQPAGAFQGVGYKHCRWLDIVLMQKPLNGGVSTPPDGEGLPLA